MATTDLRVVRVAVLAAPVAALALAGSLSGCAKGGGAVAEPEPVGGPQLVRRLTESQYRATIADVFAPDVPVVARFERPLRAEGLIAVGTSEAGLPAVAVEQYDVAAVGVADAILAAERRKDFVPCVPGDPAGFDEACARQFIERYGPQLFRRPLAAEQTQRLMAAAREGATQLGDFYAGLKFALVGMMNSPEFLLRIERSAEDSSYPGKLRLDDYSMAARLSYFLTNSTPDAELLRAAGAGDLRNRSGLERQVDRLMASPHYERAVRAFFEDMLEYELFAELEKDSQLYPQYNSSVAADAPEQTLRDIVRHLVTNKGDYRDLFNLQDTTLTRALSTIYRMPIRARQGWEDTRFADSSGRAGIQSHVSFLALHAHPGRSSPTLRGEAIRNIFLCQEVPEPPANVNFSVVQNAVNTEMPTARHRLHVHNTEPACYGCHNIMDPLGLALENFDGIGIARSKENGADIDPRGELDGVAFENSGSFAQALRNHPEIPSCLAEKMYRFAVGRDTVWSERYYMDYLIATFAARGYQVPELMRTIALSRNFFAISPAQGEGVDHELAGSTSGKEKRS